MAHLVQTNILISDHGEDGYRVFGTAYFTLGAQTWALDLDEFVPLKTGDPKINGQLENIILQLCERILREEQQGYPHKRSDTVSPY